MPRLASFCILLAPLLTAQDTVDIRVDAASTIGPFRPIFAYFGYDEPNFTYALNGRKLIRELAGLSPVPVYIRTHFLLATGDGTPSLKFGSSNAYTEDTAGRPVYDWTITDPSSTPTCRLELSLSPKSGSCRRRFPRVQSHIRLSGHPAHATKATRQAGPIRQRIIRSGANWCISGSGTARTNMGLRRSSPGIGRYGTSRTFLIGTARPRNTTGYTTSLLPR
jgi:hypothetical protein